jgi:hypothetical protein
MRSQVCAVPTSWAESVAVLLVLGQLLIFAVSLFPFEVLDWFLLFFAERPSSLR